MNISIKNVEIIYLKKLRLYKRRSTNKIIFDKKTMMDNLKKIMQFNQYQNILNITRMNIKNYLIAETYYMINSIIRL